MECLAEKESLGGDEANGISLTNDSDKQTTGC